jgi:hypothetical protein
MEADLLRSVFVPKPRSISGEFIEEWLVPKRLPAI